MKIKITFLDYWHCGAGSSGGSRTDALVVKDAEGLPYIPGKTLKGHIREMAEYSGDCTFVNACFGGSSDSGEGSVPKDVCYDKNYEGKEGKCYFSNAVLEERIDKDLTPYLYKNISSTQIGEDGLAVDKSLREIEVTVPLTLYATIEECPEAYREKMTEAFRQVKRIGLNRTRGLGRCEITLAGGEDA